MDGLLVGTLVVGSSVGSFVGARVVGSSVGSWVVGISVGFGSECCQDSNRAK